MISIFTGLHAPGNAFVEETFNTLLGQTMQDWEWIVVENNGGRLPDHIRAHSHVKAFSTDLRGVGAIKKFACSQAAGDVLLELDADDVLHHQALQLVQEKVDGGADFVCSDFAEFEDKTWAPSSYGRQFGWRWYPTHFHGHDLRAMQAPPITPQNLRLVDWSPNHVRAWRRSTYEKLGGHDASMPVADDHDLLVRTFLSGARMEKIDFCLYFYRVHPQNTVKTRNDAIRRGTWEVYHRNVWELAERSSPRGRGYCVGDNPDMWHSTLAHGEWFFFYGPREKWMKLQPFHDRFQVAYLNDRGATVEAHLIRLGDGYVPMGELVR